MTKKWISNDRFLHALNYCMLLPGPEAQQLATYIGWLLHKTRGGIVAGVLFVLPSVFILFSLSYIYIAFGTLPWVAAIFVGLKAAVLAIVLAAVIKIGKKSLKNNVLIAIAVLSFLVTYFLNIPFSSPDSFGWYRRHYRQPIFSGSVFTGEEINRRHRSCRVKSDSTTRQLLYQETSP